MGLDNPTDFDLSDPDSYGFWENFPWLDADANNADANNADEEPLMPEVETMHVQSSPPANQHQPDNIRPDRDDLSSEFPEFPQLFHPLNFNHPFGEGAQYGAMTSPQDASDHGDAALPGNLVPTIAAEVVRESQDAVYPVIPNEQGVDSFPSDWGLFGPMSMNHHETAMQQQLLGQQNSQDEPRSHDAYALLEFADGRYIMQTTSVVLGRDEANLAKLRKEYDQFQRASARVERSIISVSEKGGIMPAEDGMASIRQLQDPFQDPEVSAVCREQFPISQRPDPHQTPIIPIHPPHPPVHLIDYVELLKDYKGISREHFQILPNEEGGWRGIFLGKNGGFVGRNGRFVGRDDEFRGPGTEIELQHGDIILIGKVEFKFKLPDFDDESAEPDGPEDMNFEFEDVQDGELLHDTSEEELEEVDGVSVHSSESLQEDRMTIRASVESATGEDEKEIAQGQDYDDGVVGQDGEDELDVEDDGKPQLLEPAPKPKKKGPGRPPKNGIMSKRAQAEEAKKAAAEKAKKGDTENSVLTKNKVGRPRKDSQDAAPPEKTEKRKYKKRKPKDAGSPTSKEVGSDGEPKPAKAKKEKKPKAARSPSPDIREEDLTPEQLAKPSANYVTLIHAAIKSGKENAMSLSQIYRAIARAHPYFKFKVDTNGWQSSVRHNLSQHNAFTKSERDGKGWKWSIVPNVSIEKEKKQKHFSPPPPMHGQYPQQNYQAGPPHQMMMHGLPSAPGMTGPPAQYPPPYYSHGPLPNPHPYPQGPPNGPQGYRSAHMAPPPLVAPQTSSYNSPYANSTPPMPPPQPPVANQRPALGGALSGAGPASSQGLQHPQQPQPSSHTSQSGYSDKTLKAVEVFKKTLVGSLQNKAELIESGLSAERIVENAVNKCLGKSCENLPNKFEDKIMDVVKALLKKLGEDDTSARSPGDPSAQNRPPQPVARPLLTGQVPSRPSIPRPSLMSGPPRIPPNSSANMTSQYQSSTASLSPATLPSLSPASQVPTHASPGHLGNTSNVPQPNGNGLPSVAHGPSTPTLMHEPGDSNLKSIAGSPFSPDGRQIAGLKRKLEETEDRQETKRPCTPSRQKNSVPPRVEGESTALTWASEEVKCRGIETDSTSGKDVPMPDYKSSQSPEPLMPPPPM